MDDLSQFSRRRRLVAAGISVLGAALLFTATRLSPDSRGIGTHEQLGLAPCAFSVWTGWRCPSCGMTTAWAHAVRGQLPAALRASLAGTLLCGAVLIATVWAAAVAVLGRWIGFEPSPYALLWIGSAWAAISVLDWVRRLVTG